MKISAILHCEHSARNEACEWITNSNLKRVIVVFKLNEKSICTNSSTEIVLCSVFAQSMLCLD